LALVKAKQDEHITSLDVDDRQDKFETIIKKWKKTRKFVITKHVLETTKSIGP